MSHIVKSIPKLDFEAINFDMSDQNSLTRGYLNKNKFKKISSINKNSALSLVLCDEASCSTTNNSFKWCVNPSNLVNYISNIALMYSKIVTFFLDKYLAQYRCCRYIFKIMDTNWSASPNDSRIDSIESFERNRVKKRFIALVISLPRCISVFGVRECCNACGE